MVTVVDNRHNNYYNYNMKEFTEIHKQRISEAHKKGQHFNCLICFKEFWRKPFDIKKGNNKFCSKKCYFIWQKGRNKSEEFKEKCRRKKPEQNGNWKGGITPLNKRIRSSEIFKKWREKVFKRDNYICQECGIKSQKGIKVILHAHHIKPFAKFTKLRFEINNGLTLCKKCHSKKPKGKEIWIIT